MIDAQSGTRLRLLGGFELRHNGDLLDLKPGSQRLLAFLALADKAVERTYAAFRLWPEKREERAMANLRSGLWRLRQQPAALVRATSTHIALEPSVWVDARHGVGRFEDLAGSDLTTSGLALNEELLPDWYEDWLMTERERLRQVRVHALEDAARVMLAEGRVSEAIDAGLRAVALEPLRESAHRLVIQAHLAEGNVGEARRQFAACRTLLLDELAVEPSPMLSGLVAPLATSA